MRRRDLLANAAALGIVGLAGCFSSGDPGEGTPDDGTGGADDPTPEAPQVGTTTIETRNTGCSNGDHDVASLEADAATHRLTIEGAMQASNPCHLAEYTAVELEDDTLSVTVGTTRDDQDACIECVGEVDYRASVQLTAGLEADVVVSHEGFDEVSEVLRETVSL